MKTTMVRYRTTPEYADTNHALIGKVFDELRARRPAGLRYATYRLADGVTFLHLATVDADLNPVVGLESFRTFQAGLKGHCVEAPAFTELTQVESYAAGA